MSSSSSTASNSPSDTDFLAMSDDEFMNQLPPDDSGSSSGSESGSEGGENQDNPEPTDTNTDPNAGTEEPSLKDGNGEQEQNPKPTEENAGQTDNSDGKGDTEPKTLDNSSNGSTPTNGEKPDNQVKTPKEDEPNSSGGTQEPDYAAIGKQILAPFKANGKIVTPKDAAEAIQLMQMGANYTQKMQQFAPYRKAVVMLQNAGMMDEDKLSFLIDLGNKNPDAIKKLVKESGIDPMDIDTSVEPEYKAGQNRVSDAQVAFQETLDSLMASPKGQEVLNTIHNTWDEGSKQLLGSQPQIMTVIQNQYESGIYQRIVDEIDRQKMVGSIPPTVPFLQAYKSVGEMLDSQNAFADLVQNSAPSVKGPVATTVATPKPQVRNSGKATSAAPSRGSGGKGASAKVNPFALSDEEFMKQMGQ